ncbi:MAG TPA: fumarate hydratase [Anaerolineae bacterium]|nr:fumarate hydratase [Anaerolineae bacterium]
MDDLTNAFLELVRLASTDLAPDVEQALIDARDREMAGSAARSALDAVLQNVSLAREQSTPVCQDTGTPIFYIQHPLGWSTKQLREQIRSAVAEATALSYLRPNAVDSISGVNSGDNLGDEAFPTIHFTEIEGEELIVDLMLKGGGCENVGAQYSLPDRRLAAGRDLEGVRKVVLDAVWQAQGKGCAPGVLGVAIGGDRGSSYYGSKEALFRKMDEPNPDPNLDAFEERVTEEANRLGIGPMGFGGKTTVLGTEIKGMHRLPASFFVSVSYMCWAHRRRRMVVRGSDIQYS